MSHRNVIPNDFEGKTIKSVDCRAVNFVTFTFTDGTAVALEHERDGIAVCDECVTHLSDASIDVNTQLIANSIRAAMIEALERSFHAAELRGELTAENMANIAKAAGNNAAMTLTVDNEE